MSDVKLIFTADGRQAKSEISSIEKAIQRLSATAVSSRGKLQFLSPSLNNLKSPILPPIVEYTPFSDMQRASSSARRFHDSLMSIRMPLLMGGLSVMFFSMMIQKSIEGMLKPAMEITGIFDILGTILTILFLPAALMLLPFFIDLLKLVVNLNEEHPRAVKILGILILAIGALASIGVLIGSIATALSGAISVWSVLVGGSAGASASAAAAAASGGGAVGTLGGVSSQVGILGAGLALGTGLAAFASTFFLQGVLKGINEWGFGNTGTGGWGGSLLRVMGRTITSAFTGATTGAGIALVAGQLGPQALVPEELVTIPAAAGLGSLIGGIVGFVSSIWDETMANPTVNEVNNTWNIANQNVNMPYNPSSYQDSQMIVQAQYAGNGFYSESGRQ